MERVIARASGSGPDNTSASTAVACEQEAARENHGRWSRMLVDLTRLTGSGSDGDVTEELDNSPLEREWSGECADGVKDQLQ